MRIGHSYFENCKNSRSAGRFPTEYKEHIKIKYKAVDTSSTKNSEGLTDLSCVYSESLEAQIRYHILTNHRAPLPVSLGPIGASVRVVDPQDHNSRSLMLTSHLVSLFRPSINSFFLPFFRSFFLSFRATWKSTSIL